MSLTNLLQSSSSLWSRSPKYDALISVLLSALLFIALAVIWLDKDKDGLLVEVFLLFFFGFGRSGHQRAQAWLLLLFVKILVECCALYKQRQK